MPIQVSYGHISRADAIRESAIALLESSLSDAEDTPTQTNTLPLSREHVCNPRISSETSYLNHIFTFAIFIALATALFVAVIR